MIADDNPNILEELLEIVDWEDFSVEIVGTYANGAALLDAVEEKKPDIVLSDISMPRLGGIELAAQLRETAPKVKVILISCFSEFDYARKAIELGVCGYIIKPIHLCKGSLVGMETFVMPGVTVGEGAIVGAGSLVTKDIPAWTIATGRPAKVVKEIPHRKEE